MTKPKVSVIIPVYNVEPTLERCLESVVNQTLSDIEIVLINDGSTDKSAEIAQRYALQDSRIKLIHQNNGGLSDARNTGLKIATGEYISFVDSDDRIDEKAYEELTELAGEHNNPNIIRAGYFIAAATETVSVDSYYYPNKEHKKAVLVNDLKEILKKSLSSGVWAGLWKKSFLDEHNLFFIKGLYHEDIIFTWKAFILNKEILAVLKPYYYYNLSNPSSITQSLNNKFLDIIKILKLQKEFLIEQNIYKEFEYIYRIKTGNYINGAFKRVFFQRGIKFWRYRELKIFFDEMHERCKDWDADEMDFENIFEKQKFILIQQKKFVKYLIKTFAPGLKIKALWLYVIKNDFY